MIHTPQLRVSFIPGARIPNTRKPHLKFEQFGLLPTVRSRCSLKEEGSWGPTALI